VRLVPPELVRVSDRVFLLPTRRLPKTRLGGLTVRAPGVCEVPESGTFTVAVKLLFTKAKVPLAALADSGVKVTLKLWL
jgi:hypothetical protein